jgi:uncharacterized integral membrane protein
MPLRKLNQRDLRRGTIWFARVMLVLIIWFATCIDSAAMARLATRYSFPLLLGFLILCAVQDPKE